MKILLALIVSSSALAQCPTPTPRPSPTPTDVCAYLKRHVVMDSSFASQVKSQFKCK
jgi:hypothetical protein